MKKIGLHEILLTFLNEGKVISDILVHISQDLRNSQKDHYHHIEYRTDVFDKICELFTYCHDILYYFCFENKKNQGIIFKHFSIFQNVDFLDFGQVNLINVVIKNNIEIYSEISTKHLQFFIQLIKNHGKNYKFLDTFRFLTDTKREGSIILQKMTTELLLSDKNLNIVKPQSEIKENHLSKLSQNYKKYDFNREIDPEIYERNLLIVISQSIFHNISINYITKIFKVIFF